MKTDPFGLSDKKIFQEFRRGVFYEEIYEKHDIAEKDLINILQKNIKGNYDYQQILSGGLNAQKQFIKHLNSRWNPLEPDATWESISPYLVLKKREIDEDD
ncbi:MAG: hypothetical protein ACXAEU_13015 [Candidatus Hodarchaeales archaeon]